MKIGPFSIRVSRLRGLDPEPVDPPPPPRQDDPPMLPLRPGDNVLVLPDGTKITVTV